ncbi:MAG: B12-binding domain-containing radical SAM protein, partial [Melioribacteraceae bacterium]
MKILIGQSYFRILDAKELERQMPYPPLGALYAAAVLESLNHEVIFFDAMLAESAQEFNKKIIKEKPDAVLIYDDEFNYLTKMCLSNMRGAALSFIKTAKENNIKTIVYSSDATDFSQFYFDAGCDVIIFGEGEVTLTEVFDLLEKENYEAEKFTVNGLKFINNGKIHSTETRKVIKDLDIIANPDYDFVNIDLYKKIWKENHGYFSLNISTTRGCPYRCNWCAKPLYGQVYNSRSPRHVVSQIKELKEKYGVEHLWITDDIFGLKPGWIKEFSEICEKEKIQIPYKCLSRPDLLIKNDTVKYLINSGCKTIWLGAESGSQKILDAMDKGTTVEQIYEAAKQIHNAGREAAFFIQFGYSGEDWEDIRLTRKMIIDCMPDDVGISVSYPLPGTKFYEKVKSEMNTKTNWIDSDDLDLMFSGTYPKEFYKLLHRFVHAEYRLFKIIKRKRWKKLLHLVYY